MRLVKDVIKQVGGRVTKRRADTQGYITAT